MTSCVIASLRRLCDLTYSRARAGVGGEMVEPPRAAAYAMAARRNDFGAVQQVTLADDAEETATRIDHRGTAHAAFREKRCHGLNRHIRIDRNHVGRHHVYRAHQHSLLFVSNAVPGLRGVAAIL